MIKKPCAVCRSDSSRFTVAIKTLVLDIQLVLPAVVSVSGRDHHHRRR